MDDQTITCHKCGTENPITRTYCQKCTAQLVPDKPTALWVRAVIAFILILFFAPIGLCGFAVTLGGALGAAEGQADSYGFLPIALISLFIGCAGLWLAYRTLWPK